MVKVRFNGKRYEGNVNFMLKVAGAVAATGTIVVGAERIVEGKILQGMKIMAVGFGQMMAIAAVDSLELKDDK